MTHPPKPASAHATLALLALLAALVAALVALAGCDEAVLFDVNRGNPVAARFATDTTALSPAAPGTAVPVAVRLTGSDRGPVANWPVAWASRSSSPISTDPQGSLSADTVRTDADGVARVTWTLGSTAATYRLDVRAVGVGSRTGPISPRPGPDLLIAAQPSAPRRAPSPSP